ncbi:MAG: rhodanese-like domain-containing protein [Rhodothermia bacterium]|nr:rhodanese-like domain-containing protein [Rhodothermia bacterium]
MKVILRIESVYLLLLFITAGCAPQKMVNQSFVSPTEQISVTEAFALVGKKTLFVDVREPNEVADLAYDLPNVINIPLSTFEQRYAEIPQNQQVVMLCRSGKRSQQAYNALKEKGYTNMTNMEGGIIQWQSKSLPVKKKN